MKGAVGFDLDNAICETTIAVVVDVIVVFEGKQAIDKEADDDKQLEVGLDFNQLSEMEIDMVFHGVVQFEIMRGMDFRDGVVIEGEHWKWSRIVRGDALRGGVNRLYVAVAERYDEVVEAYIDAYLAQWGDTILRGTLKDDAGARFDEREHVLWYCFLLGEEEASSGLDINNVGNYSAYRDAKLRVCVLSSERFCLFFKATDRSRFGSINGVGWSIRVVDSVQFQLLGVPCGRKDGLSCVLLLNFSSTGAGVD